VLKNLEHSAEMDGYGKCNREEDSMKTLIGYFKDESGQTSTEYILLVAVVAMIIFKFKSKMDSGLSGITDKVFTNASGLAEQIGKE
jgi:pilus assembly protein Flp/PilA